jgi:hypothetical protein
MSSPTTIDGPQCTSRLSCFELDPTKDTRWGDFVENHPQASVFHTVPWLQALRSTYGYEAVAFSTSPPGAALKNGIVFCRINSWLTGRRLVSLPFSDHCRPLCDSIADLKILIQYSQLILQREKRKYFEVRPTCQILGRLAEETGCVPAATYFLHTLDLRADPDQLFQSFDKDSVQRRVQRAERAGILEKCGNSEELLGEFYSLFVLTRGRHHVPPSPYAWFQNLAHCQGNALKVRVAYKDNLPMAAILTLSFKDVVYYKYGCSDPRFNKFGATPWLFWKAIAAAKSSGAIAFDMGRTEPDNLGLLAFKNHWVAEPKRLTYWRYPSAASRDLSNGWKAQVARKAFSLMPGSLLKVAGKLIYRHIG